MKKLILFLFIFSLLAIKNVYSTPSAPVWVSPEDLQGETYNRRPWFYFKASTNVAGAKINDALIQIATDAGFTNIVYSKQANGSPLFYPMPANGDQVIRFRPDSILTTDNTYYVRVRVWNDQQTNRQSPWSSTLRISVRSITWTDPTIEAGVTLIKAAHFNELKTAIDNVRAFRGFGPYSYTNLPVSSGSLIKASDITDLRNALIDPYKEATGSNPTFTDTITAGSTLIRRVHITELRSKVSLP